MVPLVSSSYEQKAFSKFIKHYIFLAHVVSEHFKSSTEILFCDIFSIKYHPAERLYPRIVLRIWHAASDELYDLKIIFLYGATWNGETYH